MTVVSREEIKSRLHEADLARRLVITPILDEDAQIGLTSVDLRLGSRFEVDLRTRQASVSLTKETQPIQTFFEATYRDFGEPFMLHPGQLVLGVTLEYIRLPDNLAGHLISRSSLNRLGLSIHTIVQPGYTGTLTLELVNRTSNAIELIPGMRIVQLELHEVHPPVGEGYVNQRFSKYIGNTTPRISDAASDIELGKLLDFRRTSSEE